MKKSKTNSPSKPTQLAKQVKARRPELKEVEDLFIWESFRASFPWLVDSPYSPAFLAALFSQDKRAISFALALSAAAERQRQQLQQQNYLEKGS
jgi:ribosomal protein S18 acetylase RimI-like enzyme